MTVDSILASDRRSGEDIEPVEPLATGGTNLVILPTTFFDAFASVDGRRQPLLPKGPP
jgi:hypothetical protein